MHSQLTHAAWMLAGLAWIPAIVAEPAGAPAGGRGVHDLLYGEALYASRNQDPLVAMSRLLDSEGGNLGVVLPPTQSLLQARLALGYGLYDDAKSILRSIPRQQVAAEQLDRAWYELARAEFSRGDAANALYSLEQMDDRLPRELDGDRRLLLGQVLLTLELNEEAAEVLADWRGPASKAAYAKYNRGVALLRSGRAKEGIRSLEQVWKTPAQGEELQALKDKSNLALGYALAERGDVDRARVYLKRVRLQGPFSNAALLALGWLELEQGQPKSALRPWQELRKRSAWDPSVQESLLTVPSLKQDLNQLSGAARDYEAAVVAYARELEQLTLTSESLRSGMGLAALLGAKTEARRDDSKTDTGAPTLDINQTRYLGSVMADGGYQALVRDHGDLVTVDKTLASWMDSVNSLDGVASGQLPADITRPPRAGNVDSLPPAPRRASDRRARQNPTGAVRSDDSRPELLTTIEPPRRPPPKRKQSPRSARSYGELELPPEGQVSPLPGSEVIGLPDEPDGYWLPETDNAGLPPSPEYFDHGSGGFAYVPGGSEWREQGDPFAWLPYPPFDHRRSPNTSAATPMPRPPIALHEYPERVSTTDRFHGVPERLTGLNDAIGGVARRSDALQRRLDEMPYSDADLRARLALLLERIAALRPRVARTMKMHEEYLRQLALNELDRRKQRVEDYLEHARFDLARTYDLATQE